MKKSANATSGPKPLTRSRAGSRLSVWLLLAFIAPAALAAVQEDFSSDPVASGRFSQLTAGTESTFVYDPVAGLLRATVDVDTSPAYYLSNPFTACTDAADCSFSVEFRVEAVDDRFTPTGFIGLMSTNHVEDFGDGLTLLLSADGGRLNARANNDANDFRAAGSSIPLDLRTTYLAVGRYKAGTRLFTIEVFDAGFTKLIGFSTTALPSGRSLRLDRLGLQNGGAENFDRDAGSITLAVDNLLTPGRNPNVISIAGTSVIEGNSGATDATFQVSLTPASSQPVTVDYTTADGTAKAGVDYVGVSGKLTFPPGIGTATISVPVLGDTLDEEDATFFVRLRNPVDASLGQAEAVGTILDDDPSPGLSITNAFALEGDLGGTNTADFLVTLTAPSAKLVSVSYATADGTAKATSDYLSRNARLEFAPGLTSGIISIPIVGDLIPEATNETFQVILSQPLHANLLASQATGTIADDDGRRVLSVENVSVLEGGPGAFPQAVFTVTLNRAHSAPVSVDFNTVDGTAQAGVDLLPRSGTLVFAPGETRATISVTVVGDNLPEPDEVFYLSLSNPVNADIATPRATGTIVNDDLFPRLTVADVAVTEGNAGTTAAVFTVHLTFPSPQAVMVQYRTEDGTAKAGSDYQAAKGLLRFEPGATDQLVSVSVTGDRLDELDETFALQLFSPEAAELERDRAIAVIRNDDVPPEVSINNVTVLEPDTGTVDAVFTVRLSVPSGREVQVSYATADGTAHAGGDYTAALGTISFSPGKTEQTVRVAVRGDRTFEPDETFALRLSGAAAATLANLQGIATIVDNDPQPAVSINDVTVQERAGGTNAIFTVSLSNPSSGVVTVAFETADETATSGADYAASGGTLTFPPETSTQTISIRILDDNLDEPDAETFLVKLSQVTGALSGAVQGVGTILDDDPAPRIQVADVSVTEGDFGQTSAVFTLTLSSPSSRPISVSYATSDGSATALDNDYVSTAGTIAFTPGSREMTVPVVVRGDTNVEPNETFSLNLAAPFNATLDRTSATGTILDDDGREISIGNATVVEGKAGTRTNATFTVRLNKPSAHTISVRYATANGTATAGSDFLATNGTVTFAPGETSQTVAVTVLGDDVPEPDEEFYVDLSHALNATIQTPRGIGRILELAYQIAPAGIAVQSENCRPANNAIDPYEVVTVNFSMVNRGNIPTPSFTAALIPSNVITPLGPSLPQNYGVLDPNAAAVARPFSFSVNGSCGDVVTAAFQLRSGDEDLGVVTFEIALGVNALGQAVCCSQADVALTATDNPDPLFVGELLTYSITVTNRGPALASNVVLTNRLGTGLKWLSATTSRGSCTNQADLVICTLGDLAPGASAGVVVRVTPQTGGRPISVFRATSSSGDPDLANNTVALDTTVRWPVGISITDATVIEGDAGRTNMSFGVHLEPVHGAAVTVDYRTADVTANAGIDYVGRSGTLTFPPGVASTNLIVEVIGDTVDEIDERFSVLLSNPQGAPLAAGYDAAMGIIQDDDVPCLAIADGVVDEPNEAVGITQAFAVASLSSASDRPVTVDYQTLNGTAVSPADFAAASGTLTFSPGVTNLLIPIAIRSDGEREGDEWFSIRLSNPTGALLCRAEAAVTIHELPLPTITVGDVRIMEGDAGTTSAAFILTLSAPSSRTVEADYATTNGTAAAGADYVPQSGTVAFEPGVSQTTIRIAILGDAVPEADETFFLNLSNPRQTTIARAQAVGTILNDDVPVPAVVPSGSAILQEDCLPANGAIDSLEPVTVNLGLRNEGSGPTVDLVATLEGSDGVIPLSDPQSYGVLVPKGSTSFRPFTFAVDHACGEAFAVTLQLRDAGRMLTPARYAFTVGVDSQGKAACCQSADLAVSVLDSPDPIEISNVLTYRITVTNQGPSRATSLALTNIVDARLTILSVTADRGVLATNANQVALRVNELVPGNSAHVEIRARADVLGLLTTVAHVAAAENDPNPLNNTGGQGTKVIPREGISIDDASITEGAAAILTLHLQPARGQLVSVGVTTADGTARAADGDYRPLANVRVSFPPGTTEAQVSVATLEDSLDEPAEFFLARLTEPSGASIADAEATVTIYDNDPPCLTINDVDVNVGLEGDTQAFLTIALSSASDREVSVNYATSDGSVLEGVPATAGTDYTPKSGTISFPSGVTSQTLPLTISGNTRDEGLEHFFVNLSQPVNATLCKPRGKVTITDEGIGAITVSDAIVTEGDSGIQQAIFVLRLAAAQRFAVTLDYATEDGTALAGSDYLAASGSVTFPPGVTVTNIAVAVLGDAMWEPDESFFLKLANARNASLASSRAAGTILNDDPVPDILVEGASVVEGNAGLTNAVFMLRLTRPSSQPVTVQLATADDTATAGSDYLETSGIVSFVPGETVRTFAVPVRGDTLDEPNESFLVNLSGQSPAIIGRPVSQVAGTILDDDPQPSLSISNATVKEGDAGTTDAAFVVRLSSPSGRIVAVDYIARQGSATTDDFLPTSGTLTISAGETRASVVVLVIGDRVVEPDETFTVQLSRPTNAALGVSEGLGTILNDDIGTNQPPSVQIIRPADHSIFRLGETIDVEAEAHDPDANGSIRRVEFFAQSAETGATAALGSSLTDPYAVAWSGAAAGRYTLFARAIDDQDAAGESERVEIVVSDACGRAAIIGETGEGETENLREALYEMGVPSQSFSPETLSLAPLLAFELVIWAVPGSAGPSDRDVELLIELAKPEHGTALYYIVDPATFASGNLSPAGREQWSHLLHLQPRPGTNISTAVDIDYGPVHPIVSDGIAGDVESFAYSFAAPATEQSGDPRELVLGRADASDVLVAFENVLVGGSGRSLAQMFSVSLGGDTESKQQRKKLFQNAVWWLMKCGCSNLDLVLQSENSSNSVDPGQSWINRVVVGHSGGCEAISVVVSTTVPPGAAFLGALSGSSLWIENAGVVTFSIGRMSRGASESLQLLLQASQPGLLTNLWTVHSLNEEGGALENNTLEIVTEVGSSEVVRLSVEPMSATQIHLTATGPANRQWTLDASENLSTWTRVSSHSLVNGRTELTEPISLPKRFYRARLE